MSRTRLDVAGKAFGRWTVVRECRDARGKLAWICRCDCGAVSGPIHAGELISGNSHSCGCLRTERIASASLRHGHSRRGAIDPVYLIWKAMIARCENPKNKRWASYGGRGITVCERWRGDFAAFLADVGERPAPRLSIDRINNDRGYEPGNVRWATYKQQANNRRPRSKGERT